MEKRKRGIEERGEREGERGERGRGGREKGENKVCEHGVGGSINEHSCAFEELDRPLTFLVAKISVFYRIS